MKKHLIFAAAAACSLVLAACGGSKPQETKAEAPAAQPAGNAGSEAAADAGEPDIGNGVLNVYNWGEYIAQEVLDNFEEKYGAAFIWSM